MSTIERVLELKHANKPFWLYLSDGRSFEIPGGDWISTHPSGTSTNLTVYEGEDEEHFIPVFAITSVSIVGQKASE